MHCCRRLYSQLLNTQCLHLRKNGGLCLDKWVSQSLFCQRPSSSYLLFIVQLLCESPRIFLGKHAREACAKQKASRKRTGGLLSAPAYTLYCSNSITGVHTPHSIQLATVMGFLWRVNIGAHSCCRMATAWDQPLRFFSVCHTCFTVFFSLHPDLTAVCGRCERELISSMLVFSLSQTASGCRGGELLLGTGLEY